jgi:hypothetical protein
MAALTIDASADSVEELETLIAGIRQSPIPLV